MGNTDLILYKFDNEAQIDKIVEEITKNQISLGDAGSSVRLLLNSTLGDITNTRKVILKLVHEKFFSTVNTIDFINELFSSLRLQKDLFKNILVEENGFVFYALLHGASWSGDCCNLEITLTALRQSFADLAKHKNLFLKVLVEWSKSKLSFDIAYDVNTFVTILNNCPDALMEMPKEDFKKLVERLEMVPRSSEYVRDDLDDNMVDFALSNPVAAFKYLPYIFASLFSTYTNKSEVHTTYSSSTYRKPGDLSTIYLCGRISV